MYEKGKNNGFTILELLLVIGIFSILLFISFPLYSKFYLLNYSKSDLLKIENLFKITREKSLSSFEDSSYGIYLNVSEETFIFYKGDSYNLRDDSRDYVFNYKESLKLVYPKENTDINFSKRTGETNLSIGFLFETKNNKQKSIIVNEFSNIYIE
jgi:prepilin-type N-terminal cleavage/methylation domain-containing protein